MEYKYISACGLNCIECDLYKLPSDKAIQDRFIPWFIEQGWLSKNEGIEEIISKKMYCKGCNVDKEVFWSDGCKLAVCCKGEKQLTHCAECDEFACEKLVAWSISGDKYTRAYEYLVELRKAR